VDFEVLGPLRARQGEQPVQLSAPMPRMLLGVLLTRANAPVPVDLLVDALWAGERDPRAAKKLQLHVHRLRRLLGDPGRIRFDNGGYTLRVDPGELDAERFESALAEGTDIEEPARAVGVLRAALRLWRGDPFSDITDLPLLRAEADRLTERRLTGLAQLYCAELACGHANAIIPELVELAARHPMREQLQGLLMTALYQAGRQAEALEVYHRTRSALVEQLGLEPGNELQRLERAILTGDPMLEAPTGPLITPAQLPADITDFTGRRAQLATVAHLAAAADRSQRCSSLSPERLGWVRPHWPCVPRTGCASSIPMGSCSSTSERRRTR
jgi:DNA-binding SARP family transcriptional activator